MQNIDSNDASVAQGDIVEPVVVHSDKARGAFDLQGKRQGTGEGEKTLYLSIAGVVLVGLFVLVGAWALVISKMNEGSTDIDESTVVADATLDQVAGNDSSMKQLKEEHLRKLQAEEEQKARDEAFRLALENEKPSSPAGADTASTGAPIVNTTSQGTAEPVPQTPTQRKLAGGVVVTPLVNDASGAAVSGTSGPAGGGQPAGSAQSAPDLAQTGFGGGSSTRGNLSNLGGTSFASSKAVLAPSRKYLLARNTYANCVLYTEIVTDQPSLIECPLSEPLYSADGSTVIADAGDKLFGEQSVEVKPGQVRVFTSWTELETQSGVRAKLASLGAGPMGASGTEAWIDNHYMQRFGGAVMLSFIQDALGAAKNLTQKSGEGFSMNNSEQNTESMAEKALDNTINIAPTAHILPGTVLTVIVARDIDFSSVFENR